jgi:hypothetical protein
LAPSFWMRRNKTEYNVACGVRPLVCHRPFSSIRLTISPALRGPSAVFRLAGRFSVLPICFLLLFLVVMAASFLLGPAMRPPTRAALCRAVCRR